MNQQYHAAGYPQQSMHGSFQPPRGYRGVVSTIDEEDVEIGEVQMYTGDAESYEGQHAAHNHNNAYDSQDFGDNNGYADNMYNGEQRGHEDHGQV
jgi:hypothetical protein